ncbi:MULTISPECIES: DmpA family aminopeptidase [Sinorhizobium]|uniref:DmpA family aminopeptidase n=1 Tax=unclassified Sinorhizobium TaxID=2613772 RepID=UPI0023D85CFE|nr:MULTISPECIES: P1 family peptidase [unclassified Sinorhizobium]WEJ11870.1 P1 family peptidase [Sinorhizobium sp. M103]WEJ17737.1 P1 family peptidase [Sinorhizobium sp. K101]WEJ40313.1 P1 family peptidase [Sinorhizobium sp. C101]GCA49758.1 peptidase family S58 [Sinorhizobium sp. KGO-5]
MKTARELGLIPKGRLEPGPGNAITDVAGVSVGHRSLRGEGLFTGVTAILPHAGDVFRVKPRAAVEVINGFGKSAGLMQVAELGTIETPILLTNTFGVAACTEALVRRAIAANPEIGRKISTVNALVCECNDGSISDIQALAVRPADAEAALDAARTGPVEQGAVGAGSGMTAFGFKAGIGTASRRMRIGKRDFTLGTLVLANFGAAGDLVLPDGRRPDPRAPADPERGSVIVVMATDLPLADRQLQRVARRAGAGIARLGAFWGHGSGDVALCFTTADPVDHEPAAPFATQVRLADGHIDIAFRAAAETTQEAVLNALCMASAMPARNGRIYPCLADWLKENPSP